MAASLSAAAQGKPVEVWFMDEARVGQQGTLTRVWAPRGTRPRALRDHRYTSAYPVFLRNERVRAARLWR